MTPALDAVVTGIGVVTPPGGAREPDGARAPGAPDGSWFDVRARLGPRGYKYLPPAAWYLLAAARGAIADGGGLDGVPAERRGAAVGTNSGLSATLDAMDQAVTAGDADDLSPAGAPFFAVTVLGSRLSAELGLKGFHLSMASPRVAGLEAVEAGLRALAAGRCAALLVAAMEHGPPGRDPEEGAVALVVEPRAAALARGARVHGSCRVRTLFAPPRLIGGPEGRRRLAAAMESALFELDGTGGLPVHPVTDGSAVAAAVVSAAAAGGRARHVRAALPAGTGCLAPMLRLADLLAGPAGDALVVAATGEGNVAVARASALGGGPPATSTPDQRSEPC